MKPCLCESLPGRNIAGVESLLGWKTCRVGGCDSQSDEKLKMASNGEVIYMEEFRIIDMNIIKVWVITVRFHLEGPNYAQITKILYSEYNLAD